MAQELMTGEGTPLRVAEGLSVAAFIAKWAPGGRAYRLGERAGAQSHFLDLCALLGLDPPDDPDSYCFERGFTKATAGRGFADVWKRGFFAWEYKAPHGVLSQALQQLIQYALPLENPPLLVVSDRLQIRIHTHFTGHPSQITTIHIEDLRDPQVLDKVRAIFLEPDRFRPARTRRDITEDAASAFASIADRLRLRGLPPRSVAHFLTQCVFCLFAEDAGLLRDNLFKRILQKKDSPAALKQKLANLFAVMQKGGSFGADDIHWFNGGLFNEIDVPELAEEDVRALHNAARLNWKAIDATIFGTFFERGLDPGKRAQLGAFYTDPATIYRLIEPTVKRPLLDEWRRVRAVISDMLESRGQIKGRVKEQVAEDAQREFDTFLERLRTFSVLDPACGSGNFLFVALKCIKDVEHVANIEAEERGLVRRSSVTGPQNVLGLEINPYAAELARLTVWIGELQWLMEHGYVLSKNPVLRPLDHIENRDALLTSEGTESTWPRASVIVGNPPFLGDKKMRAELGDDYTSALRSAYSGRVPGGADLVCYWFEKARAAVQAGGVGAVGLVGTNSIRGGKNRAVLDQIVAQSRIFEAWSDEEWVNDGAAVRVSLIAFGNFLGEPHLNGAQVNRINSDLTGAADEEASFDLTKAKAISSNQNACFVGGMKKGSFDIPWETARDWLEEPNPNGRSNADVVKPWLNGLDVVRRPTDTWIIDFPQGFTRSQSSLYERPYRHVLESVKPARDVVRNTLEKSRWWVHARTAPDLRAALANLTHMTVTARVAKHRLWVRVPASYVPDGQLVVVAREDHVAFGVLHSRMHEAWALRLGTSLEDRPRYTPSTCFETFPFPPGMSPMDTRHLKTVQAASGALVPANLPSSTHRLALAIAEAAQRLDEARVLWLNPKEWVQWESRKGSPPRAVVKAGFEDRVAERTLTNLYNDRPAWLADLHLDLDQAVAAAYGWRDYEPTVGDDEMLGRLLALNTLPLERRLI